MNKSDLAAEVIRQHVKMHGDGRGQTTTVPFVRGYSSRPGDLPAGHVILVMFKGKAKKGFMPPAKTRKQVRSTDPAALGTSGVFPSELAALHIMKRIMSPLHM
jgi:hypothetical protein